MAGYSHDAKDITTVATGDGSPYTITSSTCYGGGGCANWYAFDHIASDSSNYGWLTNNVASGWIQIDLGQSKYITSYSVASACISAARCAQNFTLSGSNNGTDFTTMDSRTGQTGWTISPIEQRYFTCSAPGAYRYIKFTISAGNGDSYVGTHELEFYNESTCGLLLSLGL